MTKDDSIINEYQSGKSQNECGRMFKISHSTVGNILKRNEVASRTISESMRRFSVDETYFEEINSSEKAYFLGLLISDGNNYEKGFRIQLKESDKHILEEFKKSLQYTGFLTYVKSKNERHSSSWLLRVTSRKISSDLSKLGCIPNKCNHTYFPDIPEELHSHFIRGVFDGDGCAHIIKKSGSKMISFSGNFTLISQIQDIICDKCNLKKGKIYRKGDSYSAINFIGLKALKVRDWMYLKSNNLKLGRKYDKLS